MITDIFASLISITKGLHRDNRTERDFKELNNKLKTDIQYKAAPLFTIEFPEKPFGAKRKYFKSLIDVEATSKYNKLIEEFTDTNIEAICVFNYQVFYSQYRQFLIDVKKYIDNHNFRRESLKEENTYIIQYLKANMIWLYMELQERFSNYGSEDEMTIEEIHSHYFEEDLQVYDVIKVTSKTKEQKFDSINAKKTSIKRKPTKKVSFGYKHKDKEKLKTALKALVLKVDLLDENRTSIDDLYSLMTASNFEDIKSEIYLSCETTQFRYIIDAFKPHFTSFTPTLIEQTNLFYTKNNVPLTKTNLYKNKVFEPKAKADIDNIINQLQ